MNYFTFVTTILAIATLVHDVRAGNNNICNVTNPVMPRQLVSQDRNTVMCDTESDGGSWLIIQRRVPGDVDFNRNWTDYSEGFGTIDGDFWLGLENIHRLCENDCAFRVDFEYQGKSYFSQYEGFTVAGQDDKYRMKLQSQVGGNVPRDDLSAGSPSIAIYGVQFSTHDADHDNRADKNCASWFRGGWWWDRCGSTNLNGQYHRDSYLSHRSWYSVTGWFNSVSWSEIKVRVPVGVDLTSLDTAGISNTAVPVTTAATTTTTTTTTTAAPVTQAAGGTTRVGERVSRCTDGGADNSDGSVTGILSQGSDGSLLVSVKWDSGSTGDYNMAAQCGTSAP